MTELQQRHHCLALIDEATQAGARLARACALIGLSARTVQRWLGQQTQVGLAQGDRRQAALRKRTPVPANKLSEEQRQAAWAVLNSEEFKDLSPCQIVPRLADQGRYVASESTLFRLLRQAGQLTHRRVQRIAQPRSKPRALVATQPNQVYCWDITYLPTAVRGQFFYLYLFIDLFSRKVVGWQVFDVESAELASALLQDICQRHNIRPDQLVVHSDNGSPMKGTTMLATLQTLGVAHTRSRPAVSNDNPYVESVFKTLKYRPQLPLEPFAELLDARHWASRWVHWYNEQHRHSSIGFVTPSQRHAGQDRALLQTRTQVYEQARQEHPQRWSKNTRSWNYVEQVHLNPDKPKNEEPTELKKAA
jgi:putative transposase